MMWFVMSRHSRASWLAAGGTRTAGRKLRAQVRGATSCQSVCRQGLILPFHLLSRSARICRVSATFATPPYASFGYSFTLPFILSFLCLPSVATLCFSADTVAARHRRGRRENQRSRSRDSEAGQGCTRSRPIRNMSFLFCHTSRDVLTTNFCRACQAAGTDGADEG